VHYTYCLDLFQVMKNFYNTCVIVTGNNASTNENKLNKTNVQKIQPLILKFITQYYEQYFMKRINSVSNNLKQQTLESIISELNECFEEFLPLAVIL